MRCPTCKKVFAAVESKFAPFCSERCKLADLGRWFEEHYRVPGEPAAVPERPSDEDEEDEDR